MKKTYSEKLKDPRWQRKRLEILNRDEFKCCMCSDTEATLHVHHKSYSWDKNPWEYEAENFQTLCEVCHYCIEDLKQVPHFKPISVFKNYSATRGIGFLNMATINEQDGTKMMQIWKIEGKIITHEICLLKGTIEKMAAMLSDKLVTHVEIPAN